MNSASRVVIFILIRIIGKSTFFTRLCISYVGLVLLFQFGVDLLPVHLIYEFPANRPLEILLEFESES